MRLALCLSLCLLGLPFGLLAQTDSLPPTVQFSGYAEIYYGYSLGNPPDHRRPAFTYSHSQHNEFNVNLAYIKASHLRAHTRANLALMTGTYANTNLANEPGVMRNILEANIGLRLSKTRDLWLDAGVMPSHIGFESAVSKDCWTLSRSILADNSPYFETGVKLAYGTPNQKWRISGLVLNGWQRIARPVANQLPAFGHQLIFQPSAKLTLNSSSFVGSDRPDSLRQLRLFHNFYGIWQPSPQWGLTAGFDIGAERAAFPADQWNVWHTAVLILRRKFGQRCYLAGRGEYYLDPRAVIIASGSPDGFQSWGYSLNLDYAVRDNVLLRVEGHGLRSRDAIFYDRGALSRNDLLLLTSLAVSF
jgi:hypothetical protein